MKSKTSVTFIWSVLTNKTNYFWKNVELVHKINMENYFTYFNFNFLINFFASIIKCFQVKIQLSLRLLVKQTLWHFLHFGTLVLAVRPGPNKRRFGTIPKMFSIAVTSEMCMHQCKFGTGQSTGLNWNKTGLKPVSVSGTAQDDLVSVLTTHRLAYLCCQCLLV